MNRVATQRRRETREQVARRFNNSIFQGECELLHPDKDELLLKGCNIRISASEDGYASHLAISGRKVEDTEIGTFNKDDFLLYVYCHAFSTFKLSPRSNMVPPSDTISRPVPQVYSHYHLRIEIDVRHVASERFFQGAPTYAEPFRKALLDQGALRIRFHATKDINTILEDYASIFLSEKSESPWHDLHCRETLAEREGRPSYLHDDLPKSADVALMRLPPYTPQVSFADFTHYATVLASGSKQEQDFCDKSIIEFQEKSHRVYIIEPFKPGGQHLVVLPTEKDSSIRLRTDNIIKIALTLKRQAAPKWMEAKVLAPSQDHPPDTTCLAISLPSTQAGTVCGENMLPIISRAEMRQKGVNFSRIVNGSLQTKRVEVKIDLCQTDHEFQLNLRALNRLNLLEQDKSLRASWKAALLCSRLDKLPRLDVFQAIRAQFPNPERHMNLNDSQAKAVKGGEKAISGILNVHGPPGTGKTTLICGIAQLYFQIQENKQVLALSPTNLGVDDIANRMNNSLKSLQAKGNALNAKYVVRLHSYETEMKLFLEPANRAKKGRSKLQVLSFSESERSTKDPFQLSNTYQNELIHDRRVRLPDLSVGRRMLYKLGLTKGAPKIAEDNPHYALLRLYERYRDSKVVADFSDSDMENLQTRADGLYKEVLRGSSAVVATASRPALPSLSEVCDKTAHIIFLDEASRLDEAAMWPIMAASWSHVSGIVMVGDPHQLRATIKSPTSINAFAEQKKITLPERLLRVGFPTPLLDTQMRMVPEIAEPSAHLVYHDRLKNGTGTGVNERPLAKNFMEYNRRIWGKESSLVYFNIKRSEYTRTEISRGGSRTNRFFMRFALREISKMLRQFPTATIALTSPYTEDVKQAQAVRQQMSVSSDFRNLENFRVLTWDSSQGLEFDIGVVVLPLIPGRGSIAHEKGRVNVISTRWRCGLYIIGCNDVVMSSKLGGVGTDYLNMFRRQYWKDKMVDIKDVLRLPECKWDLQTESSDDSEG